MGWSLDGSTEFFSLEDLVEKFSLKNLNPSPAAINYTKLDYFNGLHIRNLSAEDLAKRIKPFFEKSGFTTKKAILEKVAPIIQKRIVTLDEAVEMAGFFFKDNIEPITEDMIAKDLSQAQSREVLKDVLTIIELSHNLETEETETRMREYVERSGYTPGQVFGIMRAAVTGQKVSPPLFESMEIIGKQKVIERLTRAIEILKEE
jgi:glutamyl-tRNA synthetase